MIMQFSLRTEGCPSCGKQMMNKDTGGLFTGIYELSQREQMEKKNVAFISSSEIDNEKICVECESKGLASFVCALCGERRDSSKKKESFGDPAEYLCKDCYSTASAEIWENKVDKLNSDHRYDFE